MKRLPLPFTPAHAVALAAAVLLSACVVVPAHHAGYYEAAPAVVVDAPPPAPYAEVVPVAPYPGAVWINGYWGWSGGRHYWVPGYYERARPGYRYEPHRWENHGGRWHLRVGGWIRL
ncbi:hypothetical protein LXT12_11260 [Pelomonas sp. P7]|uniref:YXWGXW repeat-containing protein n=1 Tax=Pelomonas caseinilytica TaxID=2906763 RepID=A0ABS8XFR0_9BURK|nr:hypothetical protein [Pelomonas sp. P7]MCE4537828.1 hypothetical protein [Pelomonas sp. P7]